MLKNILTLKPRLRVTHPAHQWSVHQWNLQTSGYLFAADSVGLIHFYTASSGKSERCAMVVRDHSKLVSLETCMWLVIHSNYIYTVSQKNVPSLTGYNLNTHPPIFFTIFGMCHQKTFKNWLQVITFSITSFLLNLCCSEPAVTVKTRTM